MAIHELICKQQNSQIWKEFIYGFLLKWDKIEVFNVYLLPTLFIQNTFAT